MKLRLVVLVIWAILLFVLLATPISMVSLTLLWPYEHAGLVSHFILFFVSVFIGLVCTKYLCSFRTRLIIFTGAGMFLSVTLELVQILIPGRDMSFGDIVFNIAGLVAGLVFCIVLYNIKKIRQLFENTGES